MYKSLIVNSFMTEAVLLSRNQSIDLQSKSMDWFPYDNGRRHERVKEKQGIMLHIKLYPSNVSSVSFLRK